MKYQFLCYPKCSTCQRARKWLDENEIAYEFRHIKDDNPTEEELREWIPRSGIPTRRFFNTSGMVYRQLKLKDKLDTMSFDDQVRLLSTDGMLVKRPILIGEDIILVGFKESEWEGVR